MDIISFVKAKKAQQIAEQVQTQLNQAIADGDQLAEVQQARVSSSGQTYTTLKERLDIENELLLEKIDYLKQSIGVNVDEYGAVGNGITDDTNAIQSLIDSIATAGGGTIIFSAKTYLAKLKIPSNIRMIGQGYNTVIKLPPGLMAPSPVIVNADKVNGNENITIENLRIDGNRESIPTGAPKNQGQPWEGINFVNCNNWMVRNVWIENCENEGLDFDGGHTVLVEGLFVKNCGGCAIHPSNGQGDLVNSEIILRNIWSEGNNHTYLRGGIYLFGSNGLVLDGYFSINDYIGLQISSENVQVNNVVIRNSVNRGIQIEVEAKNIKLNNVIIENPGTDGLYMNGTTRRDSMFENIYVKNANGIGLRFAGTHCIIKGCRAENSQGVGLLLQNTHHSLVEECQALENKGDGLLLSSCQNVVVSACQITDGSSRGIHVSGCSDCIITGNRSGNVAQTSQTYGLVLNGTNTRMIVTNNNFYGNATGAISGLANAIDSNISNNIPA